jgi:hypothetical protein
MDLEIDNHHPTPKLGCYVLVVTVIREPMDQMHLAQTGKSRTIWHVHS